MNEQIFEQNKEEWYQGIQTSNKQNLDNLVHLIQSNSVIPFVGAGISAPIFPTWTNYLNTVPLSGDKDAQNILQRIMKSKDSNRFLKAAQFLNDRYGVRFDTKTQEIFSSAKIESKIIREAAYNLPLLFDGPVITTNLDQLLEYVYELNGDKLTVALANETDFVNLNANLSSPCLWKIHGDVEKTASWVLTEKQYLKLYNNNNQNCFLKQLKSFIRGRVLLFIGASLESDKIVELLKELYKENRHIRHYAIFSLSNPQSDVDLSEFFNRCQELFNMGIEPIWYEEDEYHSGLDQIVKELVKRCGKESKHNFFLKKISSNFNYSNL